MIIEEMLKAATIEDLIRIQEHNKELLQLTMRHLEVLTDILEEGVFVLEKIGQDNLPEWISLQRDNIAVYRKDIQMISAELDKREPSELKEWLFNQQTP